jgi:hypothetical protein
MRVEITNKTKYGVGRWLAPAEVHPDSAFSNIRIMFLDRVADIYHGVDPADLDYE